ATLRGVTGHVQRISVSLGIDRDRLDAEPPAGADDPAGDLAAIGDQDLVEQLAGGLGRSLGLAAGAVGPSHLLLGSSLLLRDLLPGGHSHDPSLLRSSLLL